MLVLNDTSLLKSRAFINGEWCGAYNGDTFPVTNPANNVLLARVARCGLDEITEAIKAADNALPAWQALTAKQRAAYLKSFAQLVLDNQQDLAQILTAEQGKPLAESMGEIAQSAACLEWFAGEAVRVYGDVIPSPSNDRRLVVIKQAVGVVACITPWNFPSAMLARKIAPALAAGCTVICKPAEATPLSALAFAVLAERAGIPAGVVNIVAGNSQVIGGELTRSPVVKKLSFTGSTHVGKLLMAQCAATMKRTSMELGGNAPFIVFDDADIEAAIQGVMASKFRNAGQTCVCANRIMVQDSIYETFMARLSEEVSALQLGVGTDSSTTIGPLVSQRAADDVLALIDDAVEHGAQVVSGGQRSALGDTFVEPTILSGIMPKMRIATEEIFGPVAAITTFASEGEVIAQANDTEYGLAAYVYTRDIGRVWRMSDGLEYGMIGLNEGIISTEVAPFGGVKQSGNGREGSKYGIDDYLEIKYLCMGGLEEVQS